MRTMYYSTDDFMREQHLCIYKHWQRLKASEKGIPSLQPMEICTSRELAISAAVLELKVANCISEFSATMLSSVWEMNILVVTKAVTYLT